MQTSTPAPGRLGRVFLVHLPVSRRLREDRDCLDIRHCDPALRDLMQSGHLVNVGWMNGRVGGRQSALAGGPGLHQPQTSAGSYCPDEEVEAESYGLGWQQGLGGCNFPRDTRITRCRAEPRLQVSLHLLLRQRCLICF